MFETMPLPASNVLLVPQNECIYQRLLQRCMTPEMQSFEETIHEFGDCRYHLEYNAAESKMALSLQLPELDTYFSRQLLGQQALSEVASSLKGIAALAPTAKGYHVTVDIDVKLLSRLSSGQQENWARTLASLRLMLIGHPLRQHFKRLEAGQSQPGPAEPCCSTPGQVRWVRCAPPTGGSALGDGCSAN